MKAMIMSAGFGTRVRPLSYDVPKPMFAISNKPVLSYTVELLKKHGIAESVINMGMHSTMIRDYFGDGSRLGVKIEYSLEKELLGTAGAVKKVEKFFDGTFIVMSGDGLTDVNLTEAVRFHKRKKALTTIILKKVESKFEYGIAITDKNMRIKKFVEKPSWGEVFENRVNTGIYIIEPEVLGYIPANKFYDFGSQLWIKLLKSGKKLFGYEMKGYWCDIGNLAEYRKAQQDALSGAVKVEIPGKQAREGLWAEAGAKIDESASVSGKCVMGAGSVIGKGAKLEGMNVIGKNAVIEAGACLTDCIIWEGSRIAKNAMLKKCIVGLDVNFTESGSKVEGAVIRNNKGKE